MAQYTQRYFQSTGGHILHIALLTLQTIINNEKTLQWLTSLWIDRLRELLRSRGNVDGIVISMSTLCKHL